MLDKWGQINEAHLFSWWIKRRGPIVWLFKHRMDFVFVQCACMCVLVSHQSPAQLIKLQSCNSFERGDGQSNRQTNRVLFFFFFSSLMLFTKLSVPCLFMMRNYLIVFYVSGAFLLYTVLLLCFMFQQKNIIAINRSSKFLLSYAKLQCTRSKAVKWVMDWTVGHMVLCEIASFVWYYEKYCLGLWQEI